MVLAFLQCFRAFCNCQHSRKTRYYTFGESTWDLVIFIGSGALGPLGSIQTVFLAIVNVLMQVVFCAIAWFNFTSPDINEDSITDTLRPAVKLHCIW